MSEATVLCDIDDRGVARVRLNRPQLHNAMDEVLIGELADTFRRLSDDDTVRLVVLSGNGRSFCAGGDIGWMRRTAEYGVDENTKDALVLAHMLDAIDTCAKPVIGLIHGSVYGGGNGLVSAVDIAVAAEGAKFCLSEVKLGLLPATISPYVVRAMGGRAARRYFLTAEVIDTQTALDLGLVHEIVPAADLEDAGEKLIAKLLDNGPKAMAASKDLIARVRERPIDDALMSYTASRIAEVRATEEGKEGAQAFLEKRKPAWRS